MDLAIQIAFGALSVAASLTLTGFGIAWRRWPLLALGIAATASTALYIAVALGTPATDTVIALSGLFRTITLLSCVLAALGSQATNERLHALIARSGGRDDDGHRWGA